MALTFTFGRVAIQFPEALARLVAYAREPGGGFDTYDLAGVQARNQRILTEVGPWTPLLSATLDGTPLPAGVLRSLLEVSSTFADLIREIPDIDMHLLSDEDHSRLAALCQFGVDGFRADRVTKVAHLYRPKAVPILDKAVVATYGHQPDLLSPATVARTVEQLTADINTHNVRLRRLHQRAAEFAPDLEHVSLVRVVGILIWTSYEDTVVRRVPYWSAGRPDLVASRLDGCCWFKV